MAKVGRNAPCYCNSGKKYKHCHWDSDQAKVRSRLNTRRARQSLFARLIDFAQRTRFEPDYVAAFDLFWDQRRKREQKGAITQPEAIRFYEWFFIDYRTSHDRQRIIDMFRAQGAGYITPEERAYLGAWQSAQFSVYEARELPGAGATRLHDLLRDESVEVRDENHVEGMKLGDLYLARVVRLEDHNEFIFSVTPVAAAEKDKLTAFAQEQYRRYAEAHFNATWNDFLRASGYLFNHYLLDAAGETKQTAGAVAKADRASALAAAAALSVAKT